MRKFALFFAGASLLAAASAYRAFFDLFSYFAQYDDTGSMLSLIQGFNKRGGLYRDIFSPYGPFCSEFYLFVGRILSVPITHEASGGLSSCSGWEVHSPAAPSPIE